MNEDKIKEFNIKAAYTIAFLATQGYYAKPSVSIQLDYMSKLYNLSTYQIHTDKEGGEEMLKDLKHLIENVVIYE